MFADESCQGLQMVRRVQLCRYWRGGERRPRGPEGMKEVIWGWVDTVYEREG